MVLRWLIVKTKCPYTGQGSLGLIRDVDAGKLDNITVVSSGFEHFDDICSNETNNDISPKFQVKIENTGNYHVVLNIYSQYDIRYDELPDGFFVMDLGIDGNKYILSISLLDSLILIFL